MLSYLSVAMVTSYHCYQIPVIMVTSSHGYQLPWLPVIVVISNHGYHVSMQLPCVHAVTMQLLVTM